MNPRRGVFRPVSLAVLCGLAACAGPGVHKVQLRDAPYYPSGFDPAKDPYWEDPRWDKSLLDTVQAAVHNPADPSDTSTPGLHAVVKFTYQDGTAEYPEIVQSTGDPQKDGLLLHQLASTQLPQAAGNDVETPHEFVLDVDMPTPYESFLTKVYYAIEAWKVYPKEPIIQGVGGIAKVDFDYLDGKASGITMAESSKRKDLDQSALSAVSKAVMPPVPPEYAGKALHLEVVFCYYLGGSADTFLGHACPTGRNVIVVHGWRIRR